jgi:uncharacterized Zn finger protein (UPF0148 family)
MFAKDGYTRCPRCGGQFKDERFAEHQASHNKDDSEKRKEAQLNRYSPQSQFSEKNASNLDATKNMGYFGRENGKYGSHPGHDGFDDESDS